MFEIRNSIYEVISKVTGHSIDDIDDELFLEADLGLDSIKMITLMNELTNLIPEDDLISFTEKNSMQKMMSLESVHEIIEIFENFNSLNSQKVILETDCTTTGNDKKYLELLDAQYPFLTCYHTISTLTITTGVMICGELNLEYLQESWKELVLRHPSLQIVFEISNSAKKLTDYKQRIIDEIKLPKIDLEKIDHFSKTEQIQYIKNKHEKSLNTPFDLQKWPLHKISAVCLEKNKYYISLSIIHLITDGLGNQQLMKEILEIYSSKISKKNHKLEEITSFDLYNKHVLNMNLWNDSEESKFLDNYLKRQGKDKYFFNPYNKKFKVLKPFKPIKTATKKFLLDTNKTSNLLLKVKSWETSLFVVLTSIYLRTVKDFDRENENIIINLPTGGKTYPNIDSTGLVGSFAQNMALSFNMDKNFAWDELIHYVGNEINGNLIGGLDRAQTKQTAIAMEQNNMLVNGKIPETIGDIVRSSIKSNLYLSFIGDTKLKDQYNDLKIIDYESYTCTNPGTIDMLVEVFHGKILFTVNYDSSFFTVNNIENHINKFNDYLEEFINSKTQINNGMKFEPLNIDEKLKSFVLKNIENICNETITENHFDLDMNIDLGIDSLQLIRLISNLSKQYKNLNKSELFSCKTINNLLVKLNSSLKENTKSQIPFLKIVEQCKKTPSNSAIYFKNSNITYSELNDTTNKLANYLIENGIKRNSFVGVMTKPGPNMIIAILSILKSGAAYIPIDYSYPDKRIEYIINHSEVDILLSENFLVKQILKVSANCTKIEQLVLLDNLTNNMNLNNIDIVTENEWKESSGESPEYKSEADDLMVVLYTSGSTGNPKGVMLKHKGYMNRLEWHQKTFNVSSNERVAQKTSCCFDISVWELLWPIMYGGTICPIDKEIVKNPWKLSEFLIKENISIMHFVPSLFGEFINAIEEEDYKFVSLKWLIFSGEALPMKYIQKWISKYGMSTKLANLYGPTEASIDVTYHIIDKLPGLDGENQIPIGKPVDNVEILVLDENMNKLQIGETGELWIAGDQLAKGYLKDIEKTEKAFVRNPFSDIKGDFIYRSGDLTIQRENNVFEYHGRIDGQVKIRGFRIELGEIETILTNNENIKEAAVIVKKSGDSQDKLIAFVSGSKIDDKDVKDFIGIKLPHYMIPHKIIWVDKLPKNFNGKLDRKQMMKMLEFEKSDNSSNNKQKLEFTQDEVEYLPLLPAQKWLMDYFDSPYNWTGFTRFKFKNFLDYEIFNKSVTLLTQKHDALRLTLCQDDLRWKQKVLSEGEFANIEFLDGSGLDANSIDNSVKSLLDETINKFDITKWPLWKIYVIKLDENTYDISIIGHHLISDLITNNLLFNDLWSIYTKLLSGEKYKVNHDTSYRKFVELIESKKETNLKKYIKYWENSFSSDTVFKIFQDFNGSNIESSAEKEKYVLNSDKTSILLKESKKIFKSNIYYILLAPLYKMLGKNYNKDNVTVSHRVHGRNIDDEIFFNTAGNFAVNFPLSIKLSEINSFKDLVALLKEKFEKIPLNGVSYDLVADQLPGFMYPDIKLTPIRVNYLGNRDFQKLDIFEFSQESVDQRYSDGNQKRISIIEIFLSIVNGQLEIEIEYSKNLYSFETIKNLLNKYVEEINNMIDYVEEFNLPNNFNNISLSHKTSGLLDDKVAIITGGGRGIGKSIAIAMAKEGAQTVIISRSKDQLIDTANEISKINKIKKLPLVIQADVKNILDVKDAVNKVISNFGKIDILINNAGITKIGAINDIDPDDWKNIIEVNLFGTYNFCNAVVPHFIDRKEGKIINIGSDSSFIGYPLMSAYAASKHAVLGLTKSLSEELKLDNIQVNSICPALVDTDMAPKAFKGKAIPPEKISDTAIFLASSMSDYITGEAIKVYGKQDMYWFGSQQTTMFKSMLNMKRK